MTRLAELALRRATGVDAAMFVAWRAQESVREFQPVLQLPVGDMRQILEERSREPISPAFSGKANWVILADDVPAGWISLTVTDRRHGNATAGYTVAEGFRGQHLAGRALILVCEMAFNEAQFGLERVEAHCTVTNSASARTLEYAGFTREGIVRGYLEIRGERIDHFRYGRLKTDAAPHPSRF